MFSLKREYPEYYSYKGRKISKRVSLLKKNLINKFFSMYSLDERIIQYHLNKKLNKKITFPKQYEKVNLEIGFGNGEFLIKNAISNPKELFIGIEVYLNGIANVLTTISEYKLKNIILSNLNGFYFLEALSYKSVDKIFIINPDPWLKKRHNKRRILNDEIINYLTKICKSKNSTFITTDSESYVRYVKNLLISNQGAVGDFQLRILSENDELYGISRYQNKAISKGNKIYLLTF